VLPRLLRKPTAPGGQTALVVGLADEPLTTDRDHRVKVQFPWQRGQQPLPGGLPHDAGSPDATGSAPGNEQSGTWVRVAGPAAGANWGTLYTPRIGTEVLVDFIEGDVDRPVIVAALYNGADAPPFAAGVDAGVNHPGTVAGLHTQGLDGTGYNQWVLDDATGQLRMRLLCSYTTAELGLGHLIAQGPASAQRGAWRGSGFEAGTQGWASLRAAQGLLVTSTARSGSYASAQSTQMDASDSLAQLRAAQALGQRLGQAALASGAHGLHSHDEGQALSRLAQALDPALDGRHPAQVNGQDALKAEGRRLADPVEAFAQPLVLLDSPSTQAWASPAGISSFAGQHLSLTAQADLHQAAAHTHSTVAGQTASLYTHAGGIQAIAANGPLTLRAHTDTLQLLADQAITVVSVNGEIHLSASSKIELIAADSSIVLDGADITFTTPGTWTAKGSAHAFLGGGSVAAELPALPQGVASEAPNWIELKGHYSEDLEALAGAEVSVTFADGTTRQGSLDGSGFLRMDGVPAGPVKFSVTETKPFDPSALAEPTASSSVEDWRSAFGAL